MVPKRGGLVGASGFERGWERVWERWSWVAGAVRAGESASVDQGERRAVISRGRSPTFDPLL